MKRLFAALAASILAAGASPAVAWFHGVPPAGGYTIAGSGTSPTPVQGPGISTYNDITPIHYGASADFGYNLAAVARWNDVPLVEVGTTGVAGSRHIGLLCHHAPTDAELVSGIGDNVSDVLVRVDGGGWYKITARTANPDAGGYSDWNFIVNSQNYTDGVHRVDAICEQSTGVATVLEGPLETAAHWVQASTGAANNATITNGAAGAGRILTAPTGSYGFQYGWSVQGVGVAPNTFVDGDANTNATACVAETGSNCTGNLGAGTYHVTGAAQLVAAIPMTGGDYKSFYFVTDYNGTLNRGTHKIYLCGGTCGGVTGSDSNSGATALLPVATPKAARGKIWTNAGTTGSGAYGAYGGIVCVMGGLTYATDSGVGNNPDSSRGWLTYVSAEKAPCSVAGDPGSPVMHFDISNRTYGGLRVWYKGIIADGPPDTFDFGDPSQLVLEQSKSVGNGINSNGSGHNVPLGAGGFAMLESASYITYGGAISTLVRNSTESYGSEDGFHGPPVVIGNTTVGFGPNWNFGIQGTATSGSNQLVITGLPSISGIPAGLQTLSRWFVTGTTNTDGISMANNCFDGAFITSINTGTNTLTMDRNATCSGTAALAWTYSAQPHGDNIQFQSNSQANNVIIADNAFNDLYPSAQQGLFIETVRMSGAYIARNHFNNAGTVESIINVNGGNDNFTLDQNRFYKDNASAGYRLDYQASSTNETLNQNTCTGVGTGTFTGSAPSNRRKAAGANSCQ